MKYSKLFTAAAAVAIVAACNAAYSQSYPTRAIRIVIPFAPGGATDVVFRMLTPPLSEQLGQSVVIDNRPGGAATIGMDVVAKAPPDGYTLGVANVSLGVNPFILKKLPYDTEKDFAPVSMVATITMVLAVHPSVPVRSLKEFIAFARARPGALNYASGGNASSGHLACELFMYRTGIKMVHIPFKGGGPSVASSVAGQTAIIFTTVPASVQHLQQRRLIGLGVSSLSRDPSVPDIPTIAEAGVPGYEFFDWQGVVAPAGTPPAIIQRIQQEIVKALASPELRNRIAGVGARTVGGKPEELGAFIKKELETWSSVVKATGIRID
ncbi:MAG: tripartite tricarboxylate transporter substrate binding protein [Burkholderiales bacterium]|nr:tripartite tricarboxylate transporter substrate binding protein [Burkholderiales bacterium]